MDVFVTKNKVSALPNGNPMEEDATFDRSPLTPRERHTEGKNDIPMRDDVTGGHAQPGSMPLSDPAHRAWYDVIVADDHEEAATLLQQADPAARHTLINGDFVYDSQPPRTDLCREMFNKTTRLPEVRTPFIVAATLGSLRVLRALRSHGCDVTKTDVADNNAAHMLTLAITHAQNLGEDTAPLVTAYHVLIEGVAMETRRTLLHSVNKRGQTALRLACHKGALPMVEALLETSGVFTIARGSRGYTRDMLLDVTAAERLNGVLSDHTRVTPLHVLCTELERRDLPPEGNPPLFTKPYMNRWIHYKVRVNMVFLVLWLILRMTFLFSMTFVPQPRANVTLARSGRLGCSTEMLNYLDDPHPGQKVMTVYGLLFVLGALLCDVTELVLFIYRRDGNPLKYLVGERVVSSVFYRFFWFLVLLYSAWRLTSHHFRWYDSWTIDEWYVLLGLFLTYELFVCIPFIAKYTITLSRMAGNILSFIIIFLAVYLVFAYAFRSILIRNSFCMDEFKNTDAAINNMLRLMFGLFDFTNAPDPRIGTNVDIVITYNLFLAIMPILLMNYLIAMMTNEYTLVWVHMDTYQLLARLALALRVERRLMLLPPFRAYYRFMQRWFLVEDKDRLYVWYEKKASADDLTET